MRRNKKPEIERKVRCFGIAETLVIKRKLQGKTKKPKEYPIFNTDLKN